jgi:hypothetical protein
MMPRIMISLAADYSPTVVFFFYWLLASFWVWLENKKCRQAGTHQQVVNIYIYLS